MLSIPWKYVVTVSKSWWGRKISGPVLGFAAIVLAIIAAVYAKEDAGAAIVKITAWTLGALAVLMVFVAQYEAWKEEYEVNSNVAEILGDIVIDISPVNPFADQTRIGSTLRYICDCSNFGKAACEISEAWIDVTAPGQPIFMEIVSIPPQVVEPGRAFRYQNDVLIQGVSPEDLRKSKINVCLFDSLKNPYQHTITKISSDTL